MKKKWKAIAMAALITVSGALGVTQNAAADCLTVHPDGSIWKVWAYDGWGEIPAETSPDGQWAYGRTGYDKLPVVCKYLGNAKKAVIPHHIGSADAKNKVTYLSNYGEYPQGEDESGYGYGSLVPLENCATLQELTVPCTVTAIFHDTFILNAGDWALERLVIPPSVTEIYDWAFGSPFEDAPRFPATIICAKDSAMHKFAVKYGMKYELKEDSYFHLWDKGHVTKEAGTMTEGEKTYTCTACGKKRVEKIPAKIPTVRLNASSIKVQLKKTTNALKILSKASGDTVLSWTSDKPKVVSVGKTSGALKGLKTGSAVITLRMKSGAAASCKVTVQKGAVKTTKISGLEKKLKLSIGKKATLHPVIAPITSQEKVTYSSSNKKIAAVTSKGVITAKKSGTAKITVKSGKKKFTVTVTVPKLAPTAIKNIPDSKTLKKGKSYTLKPKLFPNKSEAKITYSSSNKKIAVVNSKGKITAKKKGAAVITVKAGNQSVRCKINVK